MNRGKSDQDNPSTFKVAGKKKEGKSQGTPSGDPESRGGSREGNIGHQANAQGDQGKR